MNEQNIEFNSIEQSRVESSITFIRRSRVGGVAVSVVSVAATSLEVTSWGFSFVVGGMGAVIAGSAHLMLRDIELTQKHGQ